MRSTSVWLAVRDGPGVLLPGTNVKACSLVAPRVQVTIEDVPGFRVAYVAYEGEAEGIGRAFERLQAWVTGHGEDARPLIGVYERLGGRAHLDAAETAREAVAADNVVRAEVWCRFDKELDDGAVPLVGIGRFPVEIKQAPDVRAAVCPFEGPPDEVPRVAAALRAFLAKAGHTPAPEERVVYADTSNATGPWRVTIQVPLTPAG